MPAADRFTDSANGLDAPASDGFAITPADGADLATITRAIYVGGTGDLTVRMRSGATLTFSAVPAGTTLPIRARGVNATATTATLMVGLL